MLCLELRAWLRRLLRRGREEQALGFERVVGLLRFWSTRKCLNLNYLCFHRLSV